MIKTVSQLKTDIYRNISPAKPSDSKDEDGAIVQAVEEMLSTIKPKELSKRVIIENALYDQVNQYTCPEDLDTNKIMQWYRLKDNREVDSFFRPMTQVTNRAFDSANRCWPGAENLFTIEYQSSKKFLRVSDFHDNTGKTIHDMNSLTSNGTWNTFGNVVDLATDNLTYVSGNGSLRFDINTSSATGGITSVGMESVDLTDYLNVGKVFTWLDVPNLNQIQTITLDMFSSPTDYYSITINAPHDTNQFQLGQNLLGFPMNRQAMNTIGTPNPADINQIKFTFVTNGTLVMNSVRIDNVVARKGVVYGIQYISNQIFQDATTGLMSWRPQNDSDIIILEYDTYQVLLANCTEVFAHEVVNASTGPNDPYTVATIKAVNLYKKRHKEEYIDETQTMRAFGVPYGWWGTAGYYGRNPGHPNGGDLSQNQQ